MDDDVAIQLLVAVLLGEMRMAMYTVEMRRADDVTVRVDLRGGMPFGSTPGLTDAMRFELCERERVADGSRARVR